MDIVHIKMRVDVHLKVDKNDKNSFNFKKFMTIYEFQWGFAGDDEIILSYYTEWAKTNEDIDRINEFLLKSDYIKNVGRSLPKPTKAKE